MRDLFEKGLQASDSAQHPSSLLTCISDDGAIGAGGGQHAGERGGSAGCCFHAGAGRL